MQIGQEHWLFSFNTQLLTRLPEIMLQPLQLKPQGPVSCACGRWRMTKLATPTDNERGTSGSAHGAHCPSVLLNVQLIDPAMIA